MITYLASGFIGRENIGKLLNDKGLTGKAVEIGTHRGYFAEKFLEIWAGEKLYCIDPWSIPEGYETQVKYLSGNGKDRDDDYEWAKRMANTNHPRVELLRELSEEALDKFEDDYFDFIYIDGDHEEEAVRFDLNAWYKKLKPKGIIAGHDIISGSAGEDDWGISIRKAVGDFATLNGLNIYIIAEENLVPWSYYLIKPEESK